MLKIVPLFGLFISGSLCAALNLRWRRAHVGFFFLLTQEPIYGLFWRTYVTEGRLAGIPAQATGQEVRVLSGRMNEARVNERI